MTKLRILLFLFSLLLINSSALHTEEVASWKVVPSKTTLKAGEAFSIKITVAITKGWHIYSATPMEEGPVATSFEINEESNIVFSGKVKQPKPITKYDDAFGINTEYFENKVTFTQPGKIKAGTKPGQYTAEFAITFMSCNDRMCLPPKTIKEKFVVTVESGTLGEVVDSSKKLSTSDLTQTTITPDAKQADTKSDSTKLSQSPTQPPEESTTLYGDARDVENAKRKGFWAYIGLAMSVGALALLTPCVFPMIPITISFFTKRPTISRKRGVFDASIYSFGIIFTFTGLGLLLAMTLGAAGINQFAANPWINVLIALIFLIFALNLFGLFEIVIPSALLTKLTVASQGSGVVSILLMGLTFTLTSFTCTVPFIGTILVAASQGDLWWSISGMLAFSTAFAFPFFLLALFPSWLKSLPKSGSWLNSVKVVMGFLEIAAAMKFISNVDLVLALGIMNRDLFLAFWVGIGILTSIYLLGKIRLPHDSAIEQIGVVRMMFALFFIGISVYLYTGLNGKPLGELDAFLPPLNYEEVIRAASGSAIIPSPKKNTASEESEQNWLPNYQDALALAKKEGKLVFIDFTGFACTNCRWMEANVFPRQEVKSLLDQFVLARLFTDGQGKLYDDNRVFQETRFGTIALPLYVIMSGDDKEIARFPGLTRRPEEFRNFLQRGLSNTKIADNTIEPTM